MVEKIDHIGIAVNSIEQQLKYYKDILKLELEKIDEVKSEGVKVCFFKVGDTHIELLEPITEDSPIKKFIDKKGEGMHHIAYKVKNIEEQILKLKAENVSILNEIPKIGAGDKKICFLHPKSSFGVLTELCQD